MRQDLRGFLGVIEREYPEQFCRVGEPVRPVFDATALVMALEKEPSCPILFLERVEGSAFPLVANVLATKGRLALAMGVDEADVLEEFGRRSKLPLAPKVFEDSPLDENVLIGDDADVTML